MDQAASAGTRGKTAREVVDSPAFKLLVSTRLKVSSVLLVLLFVVYYGYILLVAVDKPLVSRRIGEVTTLAIPLGVAAIVVAWLLTAIYVFWANRSYDPEVERLKGQMHR